MGFQSRAQACYFNFRAKGLQFRCYRPKSGTTVKDTLRGWVVGFRVGGRGFMVEGHE